MERDFIAIEGGETISYLDRIQNEYGQTSNAYLMQMMTCADNYHFYGDDYDAQQKGILERYKKYNGQRGIRQPVMKQYLHTHNFPILKTLTMISP